MKKTYTPEFKAKVILELLREEQTISQLSSKYKVHPNQITRWKKVTVEGIVDSLDDKRKKEAKEEENKALIQELYAQIGELTAKLNWLKKNLELTLSRQERLIMLEKTEEFSLSEQCELLSINRTSLYYQKRPISAQKLAVMNAIDEIYTEYPVYGSRRIRAELKNRGFSISRPTVADYMAFMGIEAIYPKPNLSKPCPEHKIYPYLLRNVIAGYPNHIWGTDITYGRVEYRLKNFKTM